MADADGDSRVSPVARERLAELQRFVETLNQWYEQMLTVPPSKIMTLIRMGSKVVNLLSFGRKEGKGSKAA